MDKFFFAGTYFYNSRINISESPSNWNCIGGGNGQPQSAPGKQCGNLVTYGWADGVTAGTRKTLLFTFLAQDASICNTYLALTRAAPSPPLLGNIQAQDANFQYLTLTPTFSPATKYYTIYIPNFTAVSTYQIFITGMFPNAKEFTVSATLIDVPKDDSKSQIVLQPPRSQVYTALLTLQSTIPQLQVQYIQNGNSWSPQQITTYICNFIQTSAEEEAKIILEKTPAL